MGRDLHHHPAIHEHLQRRHRRARARGGGHREPRRLYVPDATWDAQERSTQAAAGHTSCWPRRRAARTSRRSACPTCAPTCRPSPGAAVALAPPLAPGRDSPFPIVQPTQETHHDDALCRRLRGRGCPPPTRRSTRACGQGGEEMFKEFGALSVVECWDDDVPEEQLTSFTMAVSASPTRPPCSRGSHNRRRRCAMRLLEGHGRPAHAARRQPHALRRQADDLRRLPVDHVNALNVACCRCSTGPCCRPFPWFPRTCGPAWLQAVLTLATAAITMTDTTNPDPCRNVAASDAHALTLTRLQATPERVFRAWKA